MPLTTPGTRARADDLDRALGTPVPTQADGLARELAIVARLRAAGDATAATTATTDQFRTALRTRLMAVATVQGVGAAAAPGPRRTTSWRQRATAVTAGVMATGVTVTGVSVAATRSLPGDPFYAVKRTAEDVQNWLAQGDQAQGARHLEHAATRLLELRELAFGRDLTGRDSALTTTEADRARQLLDDMDADTRTGAQLLTAAGRGGQVTGPLTELTRFADGQVAGLRQLLPALPPAAAARADSSLALVAGVRAQAATALAGCTAGCDPAGTAPVLPPAGSTPGTAGVPGPCICPTPQPGATVAPAAPGSPTSAPGAGPAAPGPWTGTSPQPSRTPSPAMSRPALPLPTSSAQLPPPSLPVQVPPLPSLDPGLPVPGPVPLPASAK